MQSETRIKHVLLFFICFVFWHSIQAQTATARKEPLTRILFIYDASNSMNGNWQSGQKNKIARRLISESIDSLKGIPNLEIALRVYGHQKDFRPVQDCNDTKLEIPFGKNTIPKIQMRLKTIVPKGTTPIAMTLEKSADDFPSCNNCRNVIILITDGIEECDGDPCAVSLALQKQGIILKPFVIGIGLDVNFIETFKCIGNVFPAENETQFKNVLNIVIEQAMNRTTAQVNLLDINSQPNETNVNMTFYNHLTRKIQYNYVHTINHRGNPDTISLDPVITYDMVVHTIPPVRKDNISITAGIHNIIAVDAPQGQLHLKTSGTGSLKGTTTIVRQHGKMNTLNVQKYGQTEKYIVGQYDLEILTLPRTYISDVTISQSHTTKIELPEPGLATVSMNAVGYTSVYVEKEGKLEWIYNFEDGVTRESLPLQPGKYRVVYRAKTAKESIFTIEKEFSVRSGSSQMIRLF